MTRLMVAVLGASVILLAVLPASALFIFHPAISAAIWGPHGTAYPPAAAYPPPAAYAPPPGYPPPAHPPTVVVVPPVGSYERTLPANCESLTVNSVTYFRCGTVYYKPTFLGTTLMYEVVPNPG